MHTQQISVLTVQHDYLLFIKQKWNIIKVSVLVFRLSRLRRQKKRRGWSCYLRSGRGRRGGRRGDDTGTFGVSL